MDNVISAIAKLDLDMLKRKLAHPSGLNWSHQRIQAVEREYKRFLGLKYIFPEATLVPDEAVDAFWHFHITDTRAYALHCDAAFGHFIHHYPYFGIRSEADSQRLQDTFAATLELYLEVYGKPPRGSWQKAAVCSIGLA